MTFERTWTEDYLTVTERSLNHAEQEAAKLFNVKNNNSKGLHGRALNFTYTNNSSANRYVLVCAEISTSGSTGSQEGSVSLILNPSTENYESGRISYGRPSLGANRTVTFPIFGFVAPGEQYRFDVSTTNNASVSLVSWFEFDFDSVYIPQTWSHVEVVDSIEKPNNYLTGIKNVFGGEFSDARTSNTSPPDVISDFADFLHLVICSIEVDGGSAKIQSRDETGSFEDVFTFSHSHSGTGNTVRPYNAMVPVNSNGEVQYVSLSGTNEFNRVEYNKLAGNSVVLFNVGDNGEQVKNKILNTQEVAEGSMLVNASMERTSRGNNTGELTAKSGGITFVTLWGEFSSSTVGGKSLTFSGISGAGTRSIAGRTPLGGPTTANGGRTKNLMNIAAIQPNESYSVNIGDNWDLIQRTEWFFGVEET